MGYGMGLLGAALSGLGHGTANVAGKYIDAETEALKAQRLAEVAKAARAEEEQIDIREEQRGMLKTAQERKDDLAFKTDPATIDLQAKADIQRKKAELGFTTSKDTVQAQTDAQLQEQAAKDDYAHGRLPEKLKDEKLIYDAKNPYAGQEAQDKHSLVEAQIAHTNQQVDELRKKGGDEGVIKYIDSMRNSIKDDEDAYAASYGQQPPDPDDAEAVAKANGLRNSIDQRRELLGSIYMLKFGVSPHSKDAPSSVSAAQKQMADEAKAAARQRLTDEYEQVTRKSDRTDVSKLSDDELVDLITSTVLENRADIKKRPMLPLDYTGHGLM